MRFLLFIFLFYVLGCQTRSFPLLPADLNFEAKSWKQLQHRFKLGQLPLKLLKQQGPFRTRKVEDVIFSISIRQTLLGDVFLPRNKNKAPLLIFVHGNKFVKKVHSTQCETLSSWGFYCVSLQVPNEHEWLANGTRVRRAINLIRAYPRLIHPNIHKQKIILVGHSFGGSAITLAAANNPKVDALIWLDPAVVHPIIEAKLKTLTHPAILLGADRQVFRSRKRNWFFRYHKGPMIEVSVKGATHNDAQLPSISKVQLGFNWATSPQHQKQFLGLVIASAFSLSTGNIKMAWWSFQPQIRLGHIHADSYRPNKSH